MQQEYCLNSERVLEKMYPGILHQKFLTSIIEAFLSPATLSITERVSGCCGASAIGHPCFIISAFSIAISVYVSPNIFVCSNPIGVNNRYHRRNDVSCVKPSS